MRYLLAGLLFISICFPLQAAMMGGMGGGMMNGNSAPAATPPPKNADPEQRQAYDLTQRFCNKCHVPPNPVQHSPAQWPAVLTRMLNYMHQQKRPAPSVVQQKLILKYLQSQDEGSQ